MNARLRIGFGTDLHRLERNGRKLVLGGVELEHPEGFGPVSHSDGDALLHALCDALLGAFGLGDIGTHFPDTDERFRDAPSTRLLRETLRMCPPMRIVNVDMVVQCDRPRLGPRRKEIVKSVAALLETEENRVNLKAKTWEGTLSEGEAVSVSVVLLAELE